MLVVLSTSFGFWIEMTAVRCIQHGSWLAMGLFCPSLLTIALMLNRRLLPDFVASISSAAFSFATAFSLALLQPGQALGASVEPYPAGTPIIPWLLGDGPGTQVQLFTVPAQNAILHSITLQMGTAASTLGGFDLSLRTITINPDNTIALNLVTNLVGSSNPATAGSYTYTGSALLPAGSQFALVAQVGAGGGAYTWLGGGPGPRYLVLSADSLGINHAASLDLNRTAIFVIDDSGLLFSYDSTPIDVNGGLQMALGAGQALLAGSQTVLNDVNNHLFTLRAGGDDEEEGSIASALYDGVVMGQGDGAEARSARHVRRSRSWEAFTTLNYGNMQLSSIGAQAGVEVDSWAPGVGLKRRLSSGLTLGLAASFLSSRQNYTNGLGSLTLEGPALSAYLAYARRSFWGSLLYSFGTYDLDSSRNPGVGLPLALGSSRAYVNAIQFNTGCNFRFQDNTLVTGPFAGIDYLHGSIDGHSESGAGLAGLSYSRQTVQSLVTRVGWSATKKIHAGWADIIPQVRLSYERQNLKNNGTSVQALNAPFAANGGNQSPGQDYLVAAAGVNFSFNEQCSLLLSYQGQFFRSDLQAHFAGLRISYRF